MKNLLSFIFVGVLSTAVFSNEYTRDWKTPIHVNYVPSDVTETFDKFHSDDQKAVWFPYPYGTNQINEVEGFFTPKSLDDQAEYFEAEFVSNGQALRKVYSHQGECKMVVYVKDLADAPAELLSSLNQSGFEGWEILSYEVVKRTKHGSEPLHKFYMTQTEETQVVYFNTKLELEKQIKWEHHNYTEFNGAKTVVKTAYQGLRLKGEVQDMTWGVRLKLKESMKKMEVLEYWEVEPVHIPEHRKALEFYDIHLNSMYQVVYKDKNQAKKATYNHQGELLETVELITLDQAPMIVKKYSADQKYSQWMFDQNIEKIKLVDGSYSYRLHATLDGTPYVMVIHSK